MLKKLFLFFVFSLTLAGLPTLFVGCNEGPLEEAAEEVEDEIDDATTD